MGAAPALLACAVVSGRSPSPPAVPSPLRPFPAGALLQQPEALAELIKFHILPPEPSRQALWTTPFMSLGSTLLTSYDGPEALVSEKFEMPAGTTWKGGLTGFKISGPHNSATVTKVRRSRGRLPPSGGGCRRPRSYSLPLGASAGRGLLLARAGR